MGRNRDTNRVTEYARPTDFYRIFNDDLDGLHTVSLLLTADTQKADQCFVAGLEDCLEGNPVFRDWAKTWAKRTVIKNAIRLMSPGTAAKIPPAKNNGTRGAVPAAESCASAILQLPAFQRFVYVMSVLEKYPDRECALLLGCRVEEIVRSRTRALRNIAHQIGGQCPQELVVGLPPLAESADNMPAADARLADSGLRLLGTGRTVPTQLW